MRLDPTDPFFETALRNVIRDEIGALPILVRQLQGRSSGGQGGLTFTASTTSATTTVSHGLGRAPAVVVATAYGAPAFGKIPTFNVFNYDDDSFDINGEIDTAHTGTITFAWFAA